MSEFAPGLYVVATPIGNMGDVTLRAIETLSRADVVYAEDPRSAKKLFDRHAIAPKQLWRYDDHSDARERERILERLEARSEIICLISDAGTPLIADPGFKLVREARRRHLPVHPVPGASALTAGLSVSGLPTDKFMFVGFLPSKKEARRKALAEYAPLDATLVFYESPRRLAESLADAADLLGDRQACLMRELTKIHEEALALTLAELRDAVASREKIYGECMVAVAAPKKGAATTNEEAAEETLRGLLARMRVKDAVALAQSRTGMAPKTLYAMALAIKGREDA
ncbi:MAG: 16S rRNA (cytidine(1402)-2'-O)-methyltransferase [Rickettsiales bacterium]